MKKLISICLLVLLTVMCNAQEKKKSKFSELNQDQLNIALTKSKKTIITGKILICTGLGVSSTGIIILMVEGLKALGGEANGQTATAGAYALIAGGITMEIGIPVWIVGATKKKNITLELVKFNPKGSASINGIGLKIMF
jgi:hypothetical protein